MRYSNIKKKVKNKMKNLKFEKKLYQILIYDRLKIKKLIFIKNIKKY